MILTVGLCKVLGLSLLVFEIQHSRLEQKFTSFESPIFVYSNAIHKQSSDVPPPDPACELWPKNRTEFDREEVAKLETSISRRGVALGGCVGGEQVGV